ncbi:MAG: hypothetical protein H6721_12360 [Sandaracinus sp.]|nr:hypothetical protein [Sandaracinus sp.]
MAADDKYTTTWEFDTTKAVKSIEDVDRAASKASQGLDRGFAPAAKKAEDAAKKNAEAAKAAAEGFNRNLAAAAALGAGLSTLSQQLGPVGTSLANAASGAGALYAAMGPVGAVIGATVGAALPLISALSDIESSSTRAANGLTNLQNRVIALGEEVAARRRALREYMDAVSGFADASTIAERLAGAREGASNQADVIRALRAEISDRGAAAALASAVGLPDATPALERALAAAEREQRQYEQQISQLQDGLRTATARDAELQRFADAQAEAESIRGKNTARGNRNSGPERDRTAELEKEKNAAIEAFRAQLALAEQLANKEWERLEAVKQIAEAEARAAESKAAAAAASEAAYKAEIEAARILAEENGKAKQLLVEQTAEEERRAELERDYQKIVSRTQRGLEGVVDIFKNARDIQRDTESSFGKAFKTALDEWLKAFALQEAYKGIAATAEAIGLAITNPPAAGSKAAEAAIHFGLAALAGGASAAIPNGGGGGNGGGGANTARPESLGGGGGGNGGGTFVVNFNAPVDEATMGRAYARAGRAAQRRGYR